MADIRLLAADGDSTVRDIIRLGADEEGWRCDTAADGISALKMIRRQAYALLVLDAELPEVDGLIVCRHVRKETQAPVILISRNGRETDRLAGFAAGGNDYVLKPFFPRELVARMRNLLKLCGRTVGSRKPLTAGGVEIDLDSHTVTVEGRVAPLAPREYDLLLFLFRHPRQAFSRAALLDRVWGEDFGGSDRTVDTHIKSLRNKIDPCQACIQTVWGYGYRLDAAE